MRLLRSVKRTCTRSISGAALLLMASVALSSSSEALARVGGGQSYGGSGGGSGSGGGAAGLVWAIFRLLLWLTIEYPAIGIPLDIIVIGGLIYYFVKPSKTPKTTCSSTATGITPTLDWGGTAASASRRQGFQQEVNQLRRFDPNFSEIIFTDFCYALYAKAHDARGHGKNALDLYSPYLSEEARAQLLQPHPPPLPPVIGIIVGSMQVADVRGLATPLV